MPIPIAAFWLYGRKPVRYTATLAVLVERHLPNLLAHLTPGSVLTADRAGGPGFLQLALIHAAGPTRTVEFGLPDASWARPAFTQVESRLRAQGLDPQVENGASAEIPRFLRVRIVGPSDLVTAQLATVLRTVSTALAWGPETEYVVTYKGRPRCAA